MANWKKIITSGSNASLNDVSASGAFHGDGSQLTGVEWDGTHDGTAQISGSLIVSGSTFTVDAVGAVDIDATGAISLDSSAGSIDMNVVDEQTISIGLNGASETIWTPSATAGTEAWSTIVTSGDTDGSDAAGSILLSSVAGGIGLAWADAKDLWAEGGRFVVTANEDAADAILLHADAGTNQTIQIVNDAGTTDGADDAGAIELSAAAGGIGLAWADDMDLWAEGGSFVVTANEDAAGAIKLHADAGTAQTILIQNDAGTVDGTDAGGSVLIAADAGGIGLAWADDMDLWAEGGSFVVTANEDAAGAIKLHADAGTAQTILIQNDAGTVDGTDAGGSVVIAADAGGIGLAWADDMDLWAEGGQFVVTANHDAANAIKLHADAGTSQTITVVNDEGTNAAAIGLTSTAGGVTLSGAAGAGLGVRIGNVSAAEVSIGHSTSETTVNDNLTVAGDLTVNGTTTTIATTNLDVEDQFIFLATGSAASNLDAGIVVQSGSAADSGSALYHDMSDQRWAVAKGVAKSHTGAAQDETQYITTVQSSTDSPDSTSGSYGVGEMWLDTNSNDGGENGIIYIRVA